MATMPVNEDAFLASQCLDFCQMLAGKSSSFSFSLKIGTNFSFSLDTRGEAASSSAKKKKKTPSTLRRNARRREEFLRKKLASPAPVSEKGTEALQKAPTSLRHHPSPPQSSGRRQVITDRKGTVPCPASTSWTALTHHLQAGRRLLTLFSRTTMVST